METFLEAYITAALWSSTDDDGTPLDSLDVELSDELRQTMVSDCESFQQLANSDDLELQSVEQNGHDFWLTRNGHGAGFWDRGLGDAGQRLTEVSKTFGTCDLYIGDDGKLYA